MSRRNPPAKWTLPTVVNPALRRCFVIEVPDETMHIAAFRGALLDLASGYKWADDPSHTARDVALVWRDVIDNMLDCGALMAEVDIRIKPGVPCVIQLTTDGGITWLDKANVHECAVNTINEELGASSHQPGARSQAGEQPHGAAPLPGECFGFDGTLMANSRWLIPIAVASTYTLRLSYVSGAAWDGNLTHFWTCAYGGEFLLGQCIQNYLPNDPTCPMPAEHPMRLILALPDGTYAALPLDGSEYTIPNGQPAGNYFIMVNDTELSDNQGSFGFHLDVCNSGFNHRFDFTQSDGGWALTALPWGASGQYQAGTGWVSTCNGGADKYEQVVIERNVPPGIVVKHIKFEGTINPGDNAAGINCWIFVDRGAGWVGIASVLASNWGGYLEWNGYDAAVQKIIFIMAANIHSNGTCPIGGLATMTAAEIGGAGTDPY